MGAYSQIPVLFVMRGVIIIFTQLRPGSFHYTGLNHQLYSIMPRYAFITRGLIIIFTQLRPGSLFITRGVIINYSQLRPGSFHYAGLNHHFYSITPRWFTIHVA